MQPIEFYEAQYLAKQEELQNRGELWRMRHTLPQYLEEIEKIRKYEGEALRGHYFPEEGIARQVGGMLSMLLMEKHTEEEVRAQFERSRVFREQSLKEEAHSIQACVKRMKSPIGYSETEIIHLGLSRDQITLKMLPEDVLEDFKKTRQYRFFMKSSQKQHPLS